MLRRKPDRRRRATAAPDDATAARLAALKLLNRRDYCAAELAARLVERGASPETAAAVVQALGSERLVDDERYTGHYVEWHAGRGQGPIRIAHDLERLGVPAAIVARAVDARAPAWRERCLRVRQRRFGDGAVKEWKERARQARFLQQRGFSADQIRAALGNDIGLDE